MKKVLLALTVLAIAIPASAGVVEITAVDNEDGTVTLNIETSPPAEVRGLALKVTLSDGATLGSLDATVNEEFNTFIDSAFTIGETYDIGAGIPFAMVDGPGELPAAGVAEFSISMGVLDQGGQQLGFWADEAVELITFTTGAGAITVELDTLRGGVVGEDITTVVMDIEDFPITDGVVDEPFMESHPDYQRWVDFGRPDCWAYRYQCRGDADGLSQGSAFTGFFPVGTNDIAVLVAAFQVREEDIGDIVVNGVPGICADFDRSSQGSAFTGFFPVGTDDIAILVTNFQVLEADLPECDDTHMNFWLEP